MRAVVISKHGDPSVLQVQQRPEPPPPGPGQLRVAVRAAGVNFADHLARVGMYPDAPKLPAVVGYEVAGTVEAVGEGVDPNRVGERVLAGTRFGGYAEVVNVAANDSVALPDALTFEQGAAVPVNYATAWAALHGYGSLHAGERVLVHAAAVCRHRGYPIREHAAGAEVHGTASPGRACATGGARRGQSDRLPPRRLADGLGPIRSGARRAGRHVAAALLHPAAAGRKALLAYGVPRCSTARSVRCARPAPHALTMLREFNLLDQLSASKAVIGLNMLRLWDDRGTLSPAYHSAGEALDGDGTIAPVVHAAVPSAEAPKAHRDRAGRENVGKVASGALSLRRRCSGYFSPMVITDTPRSRHRGFARRDHGRAVRPSSRLPMASVHKMSRLEAVQGGPTRASPGRRSDRGRHRRAGA